LFQQVISPFALVTAYFSMDKAVIPFTPTTRSFFIAHFSIMVVVSLAFVGLSTLQRWLWAWTKVLSWLEPKQAEESAWSQWSWERLSSMSTRSASDINKSADAIGLSALQGVTIGQSSMGDE
jgi:hypothetical protein